MLLSALLILGQATEQPTLAMTSVECYPVKICGGELEADRVYLQNKLESAVLAAADGRLKLITPEVVLRILQSSGQSEEEARKTCMNATCAVDLGGALGADYILQGQVLQPGGGDFELTLKVWSIAGSNVIKDGAIQAGDLLSFRSQLKKLATGVLAPIVKRSRRRQASEVLAFDDGEETGPQVDSGQVTAALGGLMVAGAPTSAKVEVSGPDNRTFVMKVGDSLEGLMPGKYRWQASADGYQPASGRVEIPPDGFANIPLKLNKLASLKLAGRPARAKVDITGPPGFLDLICRLEEQRCVWGPDGQSMKPVGMGSTLRGLIPGRYKLRFSKDGYEAQEKSLFVRPGAVEKTNINLLTLGSLEVEGRPKGAQVTVENKAVGYRDQGGLPWRGLRLKSGLYVVRIERAGYRSQQHFVEVKAGSPSTKTVELTRASALESNESLETLKRELSVLRGYGIYGGPTGPSAALSITRDLKVSGWSLSGEAFSIIWDSNEMVSLSLALGLDWAKRTQLTALGLEARLLYGMWRDGIDYQPNTLGFSLMTFGELFGEGIDSMGSRKRFGLVARFGAQVWPFSSPGIRNSFDLRRNRPIGCCTLQVIPVVLAGLRWRWNKPRLERRELIPNPRFEGYKIDRELDKLLEDPTP